MFEPVKYFDRKTNRILNIHSTIDESLGYYCYLINKALLKRPKNKNSNNENTIVHNIINYYMNQYYILYRKSLKRYKNIDHDNSIILHHDYELNKVYVYTNLP